MRLRLSVRQPFGIDLDSRLPDPLEHLLERDGVLESLNAGEGRVPEGPERVESSGSMRSGSGDLEEGSDLSKLRVGGLDDSVDLSFPCEGR